MRRDALGIWSLSARDLDCGIIATIAAPTTCQVIPANLMRVIVDHTAMIFCCRWVQRGQPINQPIEVRRDILSGQRVFDGLGTGFHSAIYLTAASRARVSPLMWLAYSSRAVRRWLTYTLLL